MQLVETYRVGAIAWEECACPLCAGLHLTPLLESADVRTALRFLIVRCQRCELAFTNPRPDPDSIEQFYPADYGCHQPKERPARRDPLARWLGAQKPGRLLDFGCGAGGFLLDMQRRGWTVTGLDASDAAVHIVRDRLHLPAHVGTLPNPVFADASFEAITMRQSLEHTHEPLDVLRAARRLLTPAGRLLISVPNFDSLAAHWFGPRWFGLDVPRHLTHFTPRTLRAMLRQAGFEGIEMRQQARPGWIRHSAEKGFLRTRVGSTAASSWAALWGRAECIVASALPV